MINARDRLSRGRFRLFEAGGGAEHRKNVVRLFYCGLVLEALERVRTAAVDCADAAAWPLTDSTVLACLDLADAAEQALTAARLHLIRQIDARGIPAAEHAVSARAWLRDRLRVDVATAGKLLRIAAATDRSPELDQALTAGHVNFEQAVVIDRALTELPTELGGAVLDKAQAALLDLATHHEPRFLRRCGERILAHIAPEIADEADARAPTRQEAAGYARRRLTMSRTGDGTVRLNAILTVEAAAVIQAALEPYTAPRTATHTWRQGVQDAAVDDSTGRQNAPTPS